MRASHKDLCSGVGQLTLVEHSLCPLDARRSLQSNLIHDTQFTYSDERKARKIGRVRVLCPLGLSPQDEFYLWGCLALTLADAQSDGQLVATRHFILRQLGLIDVGGRRGGRQYDEFTAAIERLSAVHYLNDAFYDPIRSEHRRVSFSFFSYSLPENPLSTRAWRIAWDPIFFEFAKAARGCLRFDLTIYRALDPASRRLYLFLAKLFARKARTFPIDVQNLGVQVMGLAPSMRPSDIKVKVLRSVERLAEHGIVQSSQGVVQKSGVGQYRIMLQRHKNYTPGRPASSVDSPLVELLRQIGVDEPAIKPIMNRYHHKLLREWVDITLAAQERNGQDFFRRSPAAYLIDNLKAAAAGTRTPPDWWHEIRKTEERKQVERYRKPGASRSSNADLPTRAGAVLSELEKSIFAAANRSKSGKT